MNKPKTHGGARKGAGRPPRETPRKAVTVRLEPEHAERLKVICKAKGVSQAAQIMEWIENED